MRLTDLDPRWVGAGGDGITRNGQPVPERHGVAVSFNCPCGSAECQRACIMLTNPIDGGSSVQDGQPTWERTGDTFETLSLTPSIQRVSDCRWHGLITNGEVLACP